MHPRMQHAHLLKNTSLDQEQKMLLCCCCQTNRENQTTLQKNELCSRENWRTDLFVKPTKYIFYNLHLSETCLLRLNRMQNFKHRWDNAFIIISKSHFIHKQCNSNHNFTTVRYLYIQTFSRRFQN